MSHAARFALDPHKPADAEIGRIAREQMAVIRGSLAEALAKAPEDAAGRAEPIHEARKGLKRLRALARFVQGSIPDAEYKRHNTQLRDAARLLSSGRDAFVMDGVFKGLSEQLSPASLEALDPFAQKLAAQGQESADGAIGDADRMLAEAETELDRLVPQKARPRRLLASAAEAYGRCRRAWLSALRDTTDETLHEWRKSVKYVRHHAELLQPAASDLLEALEALWHELGDRLGDNNDLAILAAAARRELDAQEREDAVAVGLQELLDAIAARQKELSAEALDLGRQLLAERPRTYRQHLRALWAGAANSGPDSAGGS